MVSHTVLISTFFSFVALHLDSSSFRNCTSWSAPVNELISISSSESRVKLPAP
jgi:hypothetical protein